MNKIKVMSPNKNVTFETKARTWGELSSEIQNTHNISLHNMVAICGNNKLTFDIPEAKLPVFDGPVDLVVMIVQGKSNKGNESYAEMKAYIKEQRDSNPNVANGFFGNYTQLSKDRMTSLIKVYRTKHDNGKSKSTPAAKPTVDKKMKSETKSESKSGTSPYDLINNEVYAEVTSSVKKRK